MQVRTEKQTKLSDELQVIPPVARVLAVVAFAVPQLAMHFIHNHGGHPEPPPWVRFMIGLIAGLLLACWILLVGYINRDSARRGMNRVLWTFIAILVPNGLGIILYFLLRQPISRVCPQCAARVSADYAFCSKCGTNLARYCAKCGKSVSEGDVFCPYCGDTLANQAPKATPST